MWLEALDRGAAAVCVSYSRPEDELGHVNARKRRPSGQMGKLSCTQGRKTSFPQRLLKKHEWVRRPHETYMGPPSRIGLRRFGPPPNVISLFSARLGRQGYWFLWWSSSMILLTSGCPQTYSPLLLKSNMLADFPSYPFSLVYRCATQHSLAALLPDTQLFWPSWRTLLFRPDSRKSRMGNWSLKSWLVLTTKHFSRVRCTDLICAHRLLLVYSHRQYRQALPPRLYCFSSHPFWQGILFRCYTPCILPPIWHPFLETLQAWVLFQTPATNCSQLRYPSAQLEDDELGSGTYIYPRYPVRFRTGETRYLSC